MCPYICGVMAISSSELVLILIVLVVAGALFYYWYSGGLAPPPAPPQFGVMSYAKAGDLIDQYEDLVSNPQFTNAIMEPTRLQLQRDLPKRFGDPVLGLDGPKRNEVKAVLAKMSDAVKALSVRQDPNVMVGIATANDKLLDAVKNSSDSGFNEVYNTLSGLVPPPPVPTQ